MSPEVGKILLVVGLLIAAVGRLAVLGIRIPLGELPGDIRIGGEGGTIERVDHAGTHYQVGGVTLAPLPLQRPRPQIWIGGDSDGAVRRAARWEGGPGRAWSKMEPWPGLRRMSLPWLVDWNWPARLLVAASRSPSRPSAGAAAASTRSITGWRA